MRANVWEAALRYTFVFMSYFEYASMPSLEVVPTQLAQANRFSEAELEANRRGRISRAQHARLFRRAMEPLRYSIAVLAGWMIFLMIVHTLVPDLLLALIAAYFGKAVGGAAVLITLGCLGSLAVGLLVTSRTTFELWRDLREGKAARTEGRVEISRSSEQGEGVARLHGEKVARYAYVVGRQRFEVDEEAKQALIAGQRYVIYHTPRSKLLLSVEPARGREPGPALRLHAA